VNQESVGRHRALIAIDGSESAMRAVRYAGGMLGPGDHVALYHVAFGELSSIVKTEEIGVRRFLAGSVSNRIVQHAEGCTVWVVE
jgi:nucleotide-binding universal stress UspA family protein